jgi:hypothetical protein
VRRSASASSSSAKTPIAPPSKSSARHASLAPQRARRGGRRGIDEHVADLEGRLANERRDGRALERQQLVVQRDAEAAQLLQREGAQRAEGEEVRLREPVRPVPQARQRLVAARAARHGVLLVVEREGPLQRRVRLRQRLREEVDTRLVRRVERVDVLDAATAAATCPAHVGLEGVRHVRRMPDAVSGRSNVIHGRTTDR